MRKMESEIAKLKESVLEMMILAKNQLIKSKKAFLEYDMDVAEEIIHNEKRMNALELSLDRNIENTFAIYTPVASDLRFVISLLKINSDLERIGDYADGIADYIVDLKEAIDPAALEATKLDEMFDIAISMIIDIHEAFEKGDTELARKVYRKDVELNTINSNASKVITELISSRQCSTRSMLYLFSTIRKVERTGDHIKNIAEDIIFHHEAEVLKHKSIDG
jgi:phosphate transport system protein